MKRVTRIRIAALGLALGALLTAAPGDEARADGTFQLSTDVIQDLNAYNVFWGPNLDAPSAGYALECSGQVGTAGATQLTKDEHIDVVRCYRRVTADFTVKSTQSELSSDKLPVLALPWLEEVVGHFQIQRNGNMGQNLDELWLPRLAHLGGNISIDMRPMLERVVAPALTSAGDVNITMRSNDVDLTGLDALEQVGAIRLENLEFQDQATPYVRGLNGVKQAASLLVRGYGARPDPVPTLASLTEVTGSVQIDGYSQTTPPQSINGLDYRPVFGTDAIEIIGGDLKISHPDLEDFSDFSQVHTVVGNLIVSNSPGLSQAEIQSFACGMTNPPQNISCN